MIIQSIFGCRMTQHLRLLLLSFALNSCFINQTLKADIRHPVSWCKCHTFYSPLLNFLKPKVFDGYPSQSTHNFPHLRHYSKQTLSSSYSASMFLFLLLFSYLFLFLGPPVVLSYSISQSSLSVSNYSLCCATFSSISYSLL